MKYKLITILTIISMSALAQKEIVLPEDSTKRTWDFFKYFTPPDPGSLNEVLEKESCLKAAEGKYNESLSRFDKLWNDFNNGAKSKKKIKGSEKGTVAWCKTMVNNASSYKTSINVTTDKCIMAKYYYTIKGYKEFADKSKLLYPSNESIAQSSSEIDEIVSSLGSKDNLKQIEAKTKADKLAKVEPPKSVSTNAEWGKWFKDYFTKEYPGYTFIRQYLRNNDWAIHRNEITSVIIDRQISSVVAAKKTDGTCVLVELVLYQDYAEGKYGSSYFLKAAEAQQQILCEKVN